MYFPNLDELSFLLVFAFPNVSNMTLLFRRIPVTRSIWIQHNTGTYSYIHLGKANKFTKYTTHSSFYHKNFQDRVFSFGSYKPHGKGKLGYKMWIVLWGRLRAETTQKSKISKISILFPGCIKKQDHAKCMVVPSPPCKWMKQGTDLRTRTCVSNGCNIVHYYLWSFSFPGSRFTCFQMIYYLTISGRVRFFGRFTHKWTLVYQVES